jgi:hypothetical protein
MHSHHVGIRRDYQTDEEEFMDTHLLVGVAVMFGLIAIAASRDLLRSLRPQPQLVPIRINRPVHSRKDGSQQ